MKVLYGKLAKYYNHIYHEKDYKRETVIIDKILKKHKIKTLLDVACGTGNHMKYMHKKYKMIGLDLSKDMLKIAKHTVKGVKFVQGDMKTFKLPQKFDAIICMFSSISYNQNEKQLRKTLNNFYKHLNKGGVIIFDTGAIKERYSGFHEYLSDIKYFEDKNLTVVRIGKDVRHNNKIKIYFSYLIRNGKKLLYMKDVHTIGLFSIKQIKNMMRSAGFEAITYSNLSKTNKYRILFVGVKK